MHQIGCTVVVDPHEPRPATLEPRQSARLRATCRLPTHIDADVVSVADFYATNLPALGYTVDSSAGSDASWEIAFSKDDLTGVVIVNTGGSGLSQGALRLVVPVSG